MCSGGVQRSVLLRRRKGIEIDMKLDLTFEQIKELMEAVAANQLGGLILEEDNFRLKIEGHKTEKSTVLAAPPIAAPAMAPVASAAETKAEPVQTAEPVVKGTVVKSPIVGTFYSAPSPDKAPYVSVGSQVKTGDVLFIIESMKLMNEVQSECTGTVEEILVSNGQPVEYGQPIMRIV